MQRTLAVLIDDRDRPRSASDTRLKLSERATRRAHQHGCRRRRCSIHILPPLHETDRSAPPITNHQAPSTNRTRGFSLARATPRYRQQQQRRRNHASGALSRSREEAKREKMNYRGMRRGTLVLYNGAPRAHDGATGLPCLAARGGRQGHRGRGGGGCGGAEALLFSLLPLVRLVRRPLLLRFAWRATLLCSSARVRTVVVGWLVTPPCTRHRYTCCGPP